MEGSAPNRVRIYDWRTYAVYTQKQQNNRTLNFQACLYEGSNKIEYLLVFRKNMEAILGTELLHVVPNLIYCIKMEELEISLGKMEHLWDLESLFEVT